MTKKLPIETKTPKDVLNEYINEFQPTDADLAEIFGVSRQMVWNYKTGEYRPSIERLYKVANEHAGEWEGQMAAAMLEAMGIKLQVKQAVAA